MWYEYIRLNNDLTQQNLSVHEGLKYALSKQNWILITMIWKVQWGSTVSGPVLVQYNNCILHNLI